MQALFFLRKEKSGTCVGDYAFYCARPTSENDLHGAGAFILMCTEVYKAFHE